MKQPNVCYLHVADKDIWKWFIADDYGRALIKCQLEFTTLDEAQADYEDHKDKVVPLIKIG